MPATANASDSVARTQLAGLARLDLGEDWLRAVCWDNPVALFGAPD